MFCYHCTYFCWSSFVLLFLWRTTKGNWIKNQWKTLKRLTWPDLKLLKHKWEYKSKLTWKSRETSRWERNRSKDNSIRFERPQRAKRCHWWRVERLTWCETARGIKNWYKITITIIVKLRWTKSSEIVKSIINNSKCKQWLKASITDVK